jgi:hypothetical protein
VSRKVHSNPIKAGRRSKKGDFMRSSQTKLTIILMLAGLVLTCPAGFQAFSYDGSLTRETLRGLQGIEVLMENIAPEAEPDGLTTRQVQTDVELRLRQSGIRVLSREEGRTTPGRPSLYINVNTSKRDGRGFYAYHVTVALNQDVWLARDLAIQSLETTTWSVSTVGSVGEAGIREGESCVST